MKRLLFNTFFALLVCNATAQTISVAPIEAEVGTTTNLIVKIDNVGENTTAMQFNLSLPDGITVDETNINQGEAAISHTMTIRTLANGDRMFVFYNMDEQLISNGTVLSLPVTMPKDAGVLNGRIYTVRTASTDLVSHKCSDAAFTVTVTGVKTYKLTYVVDGETYKTYDVEYGAAIIPEPAPTKEGYMFSGWSEIPETMPAHDVTVTGTFELHFDVGHVVKALNFIMGGNPTAEDMELYDMNHDGVLNIGDVILIVRNILEHGGSVQPAPNAGMLADFSPYTATQFELKTGNAHVNNIRLVENMQQTHRLMYRQIDEETYAVVIYSQSNELLRPDNDNIIVVETDGDAAEAMAIRNITAATSTGETTSYQGLQVATGIHQVENSESTAVVYDLKGLRIEGSKGQKKGVYINNGKKAIVR